MRAIPIFYYKLQYSKKPRFTYFSPFLLRRNCTVSQHYCKQIRVYCCSYISTIILPLRYFSTLLPFYSLGKSNISYLNYTIINPLYFQLYYKIIFNNNYKITFNNKLIQKTICNFLILLQCSSNNYNY